MKACAKNRKSIALLAIGSLESQPTRELRAHMETCPGCREYLAEISGVTATLRAGEMESDIRALEGFHLRTVAALKKAEKRTFVAALALRVQSLLSWRIALPACAVAAVVIALLSTGIHHSHDVILSTPTPRAPMALDSRANLDPTAANYEMIANQSLEKLDELITRQGNQNPSPGPVYTASTLPNSVLSE